MKLTILAFFLGLMSLSAASTYSQSTKITLNLERSTLIDVFKQIEAQSEFVFIYKNEAINVDKKVDVKAEGATVDKILDQVLQDFGVKYEIIDKQIIVTPEHSISSKTDGIKLNEAASQPAKKEISGSVKDSKGLFMPGVSVFVKGTTIGTNTDNDGKFTLSVSADAKTLVFSFVGMKSQEVTITGKTSVTIVLMEEVAEVSEVVVVGYGIQKKTTMTGAVSTIDAAKLIQMPVANVSQMLAGRVPGITAVQGSGQPGEDFADLRIRGGAKNGVLIVVDGIIGRDLNTINPNDVESFSILKDAAATAVYGARAQNGVILITTKRGKIGAVQVSYNAYSGFQTPGFKRNFMSMKENYLYQNQLGQQYGKPDLFSQKYFDIIGKDPDGLKDTISGIPNGDFDNYGDLIKKYTPMQQHTISIMGGTAKSNYYCSLGVLDQKAAFKVGNYGYNRYSMRMNADTKFLKDDALKVSMSLFNQFQDNKRVAGKGEEGLFNDLLWGAHTSRPLKWSDGRYTQYFSNAAVDLDPAHGFTNDKNRTTNASMQIEYDVIGVKGLKISAQGAYDYNSAFEKTFIAVLPFYQRFTDTKPVVPTVEPTLYEKNSESQALDLQAQISYNKVIGNNEISGLLNYSQNSATGYWFDAQQRHFITGLIPEFFMGSNNDASINGLSTNFGRKGIVGRFTEYYKKRYLMEVSFRYDASMNFPSAKRWGLFPAVSLGWRATEETFVKELISSRILSNLKFRASYGITGNDAVPYQYPYLASYGVNPNTTVLGNGIGVTGIYEDHLPSFSLTWEKTNNVNGGIDFGFLDNHLYGTFDIFYARTTGIALERGDKSATMLGANYPPENIGITRRGGYEFEVNYRGRALGNKLNYNVGTTFGYWSKLWEFTNEIPANLNNPPIRITQRDPYFGTLLYQSPGLYQSNSEILNSARPATANVILPGYVKVKDMNGDGKIDANDQAYVNRSDYPQIQGGINLSAEYKGFELNANFMFSAMVSRMLDNQMRSGSFGNNFLKGGTDFWTPTNTGGIFPRPSIGDASSDLTMNNLASTYWLFDASYLRLKNISISYDFAKLLKDNKKIIKLYISAVNLFTVTKVPSYIDAEAFSNGGSSYPLMKTYTLGLNVSF